MKKKIIRYALIGFLSGMAIGNFIAFFFAWMNGTDQLFPASIINRFGSETSAFIIHTIFSGLHGALCFSGVIFYEIEEWGLAKATFLHCLLINASFLINGLFLEWIPSDPASILVSTLIISVMFFIIWIIMHTHCKREVRDLNQLLQKEKNEKKE